jgi:hypothetical protein
MVSKCDTFVEGYRYLPLGESWTREGGTMFHGETISPWENYDELDARHKENMKNNYSQMC